MDNLFGPTITLERITPERAKEYMANNIENNRTIKREVVKRYATDMREGRFTLNGETLKFSCSGKFIDGQHRCLACIESQTPFDAYVVRGLDEDAFRTIDTGNRRSPADMLHHYGVMNSKTVAAAIRWLPAILGRSILDTRATSARGFTHDDMYIYVQNNPKIADAAAFVVGKKTLKKLVPPALSAALLFLFMRRNEKDALAFLTVVNTGELQEGMEPAIVLREMLLRNALQPANRKVVWPVMCAWIINGFNAARRRQRPHHLRGPVAGDDGIVRLPELT